MYHRRDIDLTAGNPLDPSTLTGVNVYVNSRQHSVALRDIPDWYRLGARCFRCKHAALIDRWELASRFGKHRMIITLEPLLRCTGCGNREANDFVLAKMPR